MTEMPRSAGVWVCSMCGERAAEPCTAPLPVTVRGRTYLVGGLEYEHCSACGESLLDADQLDLLDARAAALARTSLGRLDPFEIVELRQALQVTQRDFERLLDASPGSVGRWERGEVVQSGTADRLMRLLHTHPELADELCQPDLIAREGRGPYKTRKK